MNIENDPFKYFKIPDNLEDENLTEKTFDCQTILCEEWCDEGPRTLPCPAGITRLHDPDACIYLFQEWNRRMANACIPKMFQKDYKTLTGFYFGCNKRDELLEYFKDIVFQINNGISISFRGKEEKRMSQVAVTLLKEAIHHFSGRYISFHRLMTDLDLRSGSEKADYVAKIEDYDFLLIDGIEDYPYSSWQKSFLWRILEERVLEMKTTVITSTMTDSQSEKFYPAFVARRLEEKYKVFLIS